MKRAIIDFNTFGRVRAYVGKKERVKGKRGQNQEKTHAREIIYVGLTVCD